MWLHSEVITLGDIPRYWARRKPGARALIDGSAVTTWAELDASSDRIAQALVSTGIRCPANVGFLGKNSALYFELLFGVTKAGLAMAPLNWRLSIPELVAITDDAQCPVVFVDSEFSEVLDAVAAQCATRFEIVRLSTPAGARSGLDQWLQRGVDADLPRVHPLDTAVLIYTSGTTGKPKGVEETHRAFDGMRLCEHLGNVFDWQDGDVMLTVMPVFHLVGTGLSIQALYNGAAISVLPMLEPVSVLKVIARDRPSICALVPTAIQLLADHPESESTDFSSLRVIMYAGSSIASAVLQRAIKRMGCGFAQFYGASETLSAQTLLRPEEHDPANEQRLRSCGRPLPQIEFKVVDPEGREVPTGTVGEFWVRGPSIFRSYWRQPEATAAALHEGWYRTGDAGYRDAEGFLYIVDRVKDMIVSGGENVYSAEVEQALAKHPAVQSCAVVGLPDAKWGEAVTAVVVLRQGAQATASEIITHCRGLIAAYKAPKQVHFALSLPMTSSGKIMKREVRALYLRDRSADQKA
ncbi:long-chain-fatty-acid--CoA ligase [Panacagrimonas sp.]|uniref:long-chain-fatty-acid--CoA ligase n=1 Tax=Panacagrimonas sp. TaxID=2480088 RepID=UPI003B526ACA